MSHATQFLTRHPRSPELFGALTPLGLPFLTLSRLSVSSPLFRVALKKQTHKLLTKQGLTKQGISPNTFQF